MNVSTIKRKFASLIERIKLSDSEYQTLKFKAETLDNISPAIDIDIDTNKNCVKDGRGIVLMQFSQRRAVITVDVEQLIRGFGISWDSEYVDIKVIQPKNKELTDE